MSCVIFAPVAASEDMLAQVLSAARLPTDDLGDPGRAFFALSDDAGPIGFIGLEGTGADRLLRSRVVLPARKRWGYGGLLVAHAEAHARQDGVERLHLLTQTVPDFFRSRGYRPAERASAPASITSTAQFASLCPASATYFVKDIA
ncbi:arsenic resistance N-acetyltransferase ArsN2 [Sphingomonas oryzagri]